MPRSGRLGTGHKPKAGFSIIELLIAVIIIGILASILIAVLLRRAEDARIAAAESDLENLQGAEERAYLGTNWLFRFYVLDDAMFGDGAYRPGDLSDYDGVRDERINTSVADPIKMFIYYTHKPGVLGEAFAVGTDYTDLYDRLVKNETAFGWGGPYINYSSLRDADSNDIPEDPWGSEYLMFTPAGLIEQHLGITLQLTSFIAMDGSTVALMGPFFDRCTVLSLGPNRKPGDGTGTARFGTDDDLIRQF